ncbi:signal peptide peptidase SppA [Candidatus Avelusimicrobium stercoris]|uniref:signal peptide peptidase SppA n=1 Tax=Candidatus Avelusimicrobium stercoris TaxID=1947924 RepID=UPI003D0A1226
MPENDKANQTNTDISLPKEEWEKKLLENEKTALTEFPLPQEPNEKKPADKHAVHGIWAVLLLAVFAVSAVCGVYLTVKPVAKCAPAKAAEKEEGTSKLAAAFSRAKGEKGIAWIKVRGVIAQDNNSSAFSRPSGASSIAKKIREAGQDDNVQAIVLDINSPGGTVASVQNIYSEILKAKEKKKVVALFRDVAASGGFYIAMAADKIVAEPGTITGSVGVIMQTSNVEGLFDKIGVKVTPITSGKYKDMGSSFRPMSDAEKAILQDMVNDTYTQFFAAVKAGRPNVKPEDLTEYTDGRVFTGQRAYNLGFVDKLGGEEDARLLAGELAGIKDPKVITSRPDGLRELIFSFGSSMENQTLAKQLQTLATPSVSYLWVN